MTTFLGLPAWVPPWNFTGSLDNARVSTSALGANPTFVCLEQLAHKARPDVRYFDYVLREYAPFGDFWLGLARDALLLMLEPFTPGAARVTTPEFAVEQAAQADSMRQWLDASKVAAHAAVRGYLTALDSMRLDDPTWSDARFAPALVLADEAGNARSEWTAWGLHVIRDGGQIRETHLLRHRDAGTRPLPDARISAVAHITGAGFVPDPALSPWDPFQPSYVQPELAARVLVREVAVLDGSHHTLFDGTPDQAESAFSAGVPHVLDPYRGGAFRPGSRCCACKDRPYCPGINQLRGGLGVVPRSPYALPVSPGDLSDQMSCPRRVHLRRDLGLPRVPTTTSHAAERGIRVHRWLEAAHQRGHACTPEDLPEGALPDLASELGWSEDEYLTTRPLLVGHLDWCFMDDATDVELERDVTMWDTESNVIFSTRLDATYLQPGFGRVIRETKTISYRRLSEVADEYELIEMFPQVAFALSMLAIGWDPVSHKPFDPANGPGLIELELLWADNSSIVTFDPSHHDHAMTARRFLADAVDRRITDNEHTAQPGRQCQWCSMRDWCDARTDDAVWTPPDADLLAEATRQERRALVDVLAEPWSATDDEEIPF